MDRAHLQKTVALLVSLLSLSSASAAQRVTRLPSLSQLLSEDLSTIIVGIDYRGEAEKSPTLFFATKGTEVDWDHLRAVPGLEISDWGNRYTRLTFTVTVEDMKPARKQQVQLRKGTLASSQRPPRSVRLKPHLDTLNSGDLRGKSRSKR